MQLTHFARPFWESMAPILTPILTNILSVDFPTSGKCISVVNSVVTFIYNRSLLVYLSHLIEQLFNYNLR